ncbi:hypothetical protein JB92DRAFT_80135 [Gautieria morchelliformis]|nr:hypothetical protein JB92DRAFT_80135 [Gautieria morchelliformis]
MDSFISMQATRYSTISALAFLIYNHALTIDDEIEYVWKRQWSLGKILYILSRYFGSLTLILHCMVLLSKPFTPKVCGVFFPVDGVAWNVALLISEFILQARIFAVYDRSKAVLAFMMVLCIAEKASTLILLNDAPDNGNDSSTAPGSLGCFASNLPQTPIFKFSWLPVLIYETILCLLMVYKAWMVYIQFGFYPLLSLIIRDSIFYYFSVCATLLLNCLIWILQPGWIQFALGWALAVPCVAGSRLLLNMRERYFKDVSLPRVPSSHRQAEMTGNGAGARPHAMTSLGLPSEGLRASLQIVPIEEQPDLPLTSLGLSSEGRRTSQIVPREEQPDLPLPGSSHV